MSFVFSATIEQEGNFKLNFFELDLVKFVRAVIKPLIHLIRADDVSEAQLFASIIRRSIILFDDLLQV